MRKKALRIRPIGYVRGGELVMERDRSAALKGIEGFSHVIVLYWLHEARPERKRVRGIGLFATRSSRRPNPIGISVARLKERRENVLRVAGLDAWEGTPILDVKPYTRRDFIRGFKVPSWVKRWDKLERDPLRRYG